jgi:hypothetical protein
VVVNPAPGPLRVVFGCGRSFRQARWASLTRGASRSSPAGSVSHTCPPLIFGSGRLAMPLWRTQATNLRARVTAADNGLPPSAIQTFFGGGEAGPPPTSVVVGDCAPAGPVSPIAAAVSSPSPARAIAAATRPPSRGSDAGRDRAVLVSVHPLGAMLVPFSSSGTGVRAYRGSSTVATGLRDA